MADAAARVLAAEDLRYAAMLQADAAALAELLSDRLGYQHSTGVRDGKPELLAKIGSGALTYLSLDHPVERVEVVGDAVLVFGRMRGEVLVGGQPRRLDNSVLAVWAAEAGGWRLIAFQPTPSPA